MFLPSDSVIGNATILGPDSFVDTLNQFLIKIQMTLQGTNSLTQLTNERKNLDRNNVESFKSNNNFTVNSVRINIDNLAKDHMQIIKDTTKLIITSLLNEVAQLRSIV